MTGKLEISLAKKADWKSGVQFAFATAPKSVTVESAGKDAGDIRFDPTNKKAIVSLGAPDKVSPEMIRRAGGAIAKWISKNDLSEVGIDLTSLPVNNLPLESSVGALVEGLLLGGFTFEKYKSSKKNSVSKAQLLTGKDSKSLRTVVERATITSEAVNLSREWAHEPPNVINPVSLAGRVQKLASEVGLKCRVLDDKQLEKMGAGAIVAVGKGSATPSRLIVL